MIHGAEGSSKLQEERHICLNYNAFFHYSKKWMWVAILFSQIWLCLRYVLRWWVFESIKSGLLRLPSKKIRAYLSFGDTRLDTLNRIVILTASGWGNCAYLSRQIFPPRPFSNKGNISPWAITVSCALRLAWSRTPPFHGGDRGSYNMIVCNAYCMST